MSGTIPTPTEPKDADKGEQQSAPPWGDDFNAERAWTLIENLRAEKATLKGERDTYKADLAETARKLQESATGDADADAKIKAAEQRAEAAERGLWTERALRKFPDVADYEEFLTGANEEEILAKAEKLAGKGKAKDADADVSRETDADADKDANHDAGIPGKPAPDLTPGHGGDAPVAFDPAAIAKAARSATY